MNNYPEYARIGDKLYKINTDFKFALECEKIAKSDICEEEKVLAIIYLLFGEEGLNSIDNYEQIFNKCTIFLMCGKEPNEENEEPDMDFEQDKSYIKASFYTDYGIPNIYDTNMHWWEFCDLMNGLTDKCVLNRVRFIRNFDTTGIKDQKVLKEWNKQKKSVELKKKEPKITKEQEESMERFLEQINYNRKEE